jgi:hypothetical protein
MISLRKAFNLHWLIPRLGLPTGAIVLLYLIRLNDVTVLQFVLAFGLICIPWLSYLRWREGSREGLPIFAMLAFAYCIYYAVPLFLSEQNFSTLSEPIGHQLSESSLSQSLLMALIGVCCLWLGMKSGLARFLVPRTQLSLSLTTAKLNYTRAVLVIGGLLNLSQTPILLAGEGSRQFISIIVAVMPMLAFAILFRNFLRGRNEAIDNILILAFLIVRLFSGLSGGWLGVSASILIVCGAIYVAERKRVPKAALFAVVLFTLFFQVGKEDFRKTYWQAQGQVKAEEQDSGGGLERVTFWAQTSLDKWQEALTDPGGGAFRDAINQSIARIALLPQTANVIEQTPSVVPYQNGWLYSYMVVSFIPRFIWPEKPSVSEANRFYQVAYGLTAEEELNSTTISAGLLAEGFINFGWVGVVGIMFAVGIFFDFYQRTFLAESAGVLMNGIGLILLPGFLAIEAQIALYLSGIIQQVAVLIVVMLPVVRILRPRAEGSFKRVQVSESQPLLLSSE